MIGEKCESCLRELWCSGEVLTETNRMLAHVDTESAPTLHQ
ncbi:Uncharacterised protein [Mycobacteroides abscessus subsp. massiliense]|nr:Uncharacterised protein [Mycobacteroides abscessus subsp. massiliense]